VIATFTEPAPNDTADGAADEDTTDRAAPPLPSADPT
jgi:hypothetical protein